MMDIYLSVGNKTVCCFGETFVCNCTNHVLHFFFFFWGLFILYWEMSMETYTYVQQVSKWLVTEFYVNMYSSASDAVQTCSAKAQCGVGDMGDPVKHEKFKGSEYRTNCLTRRRVHIKFNGLLLYYSSHPRLRYDVSEHG